MLAKIVRLATLSSLIAATSCASSSALRSSTRGPQSIQFRMRDFHLRSGLRVVVEEDRAAPVAGVVTVVGVGSTSDPPGKEGLAHLVEHLTFRARPSPGRNVWSLLAQAGAADVNASTSFDATIFHEFGPRDGLVDYLTLEGVRILDPLGNVDEATFAVEREVVRNELRQRGETNVMGSVFAAVQRATFPQDHPYARPVIGTHESLSALTLEDARAFVREHYRPSNMTVVVIGDVQLEGIEKTLRSSWSPSLDAPTEDAVVKGPRLATVTPPPPEPPPGEAIVEMTGAVLAPELFISWSLPRAYDASSYLGALAVGSARRSVAAAAATDDDVLGGGAFLVPGNQASMLVARVLLRDGANPQASAQRVLNGLYREWMTSDGSEAARWGEARFAQQQGQMFTATLGDAEDVVGRGRARAEFVHFAGDPALYSRQLGALGALDRDAAATFDRRYVNRKRARMVLVRPLPAGERAPAGRTGVNEPPASNGTRVSYDIASLPKIALPVGVASAFHGERLDNGLVVQAARHGAMPLVTIGLTFRAGTAAEPSDGAASVALALATPARPRHGHFEDYGALFSQTVTADSLSFHVLAPSEHLGPVLAVLADHLSTLRVHGELLPQFDREVLPYLRKASARPERVGGRAFFAALFGGHPYGHVGTLDGARPSEGDANRWLEDTISPDRATLAIAGDVDVTAALESARAAFEGWKGDASGPPPASPAPLAEAGRGAKVVTHRPGASQAEVLVGCRMPAASAADKSRQAILSAVLGGRLNGAIRTELGASYGFTAQASVYRGGSSVLLLGGTVENGALAATLRIVRAQLANAGRLTEEDYRSGIWSAARSYNLGLATTGQWVDDVLAASRYGWTLDALDAKPAVFASFGAADRARYAEVLERCAREGVVSIVGDEPTLRRALDESWR